MTILLILAWFLLILIPYAASISFNYTNITPNDRNMFRFEGGAYISDDGIEVTPENKNGTVTGLVTYNDPLHLWDKKSRELASFSTSFSFVKQFHQDDLYRDDDGIKFFLATNSSVINGITVNDTADHFVWVEFDPYCNGVENSSSECDHVGIHVNTLESDIHQQWHNDLSSGRECQAWIEYDSVSKNLSVSFTGFRNNTVIKDRLVHTVDLRDELPEWVVFGFSAATGVLFDKSTVKSWKFSSQDLQADDNNGLSPKKLRLVVGLIGGVSGVITLFVILAFVLWRKKKRHGEEFEFSAEMNHELERGATGPRRFSYLELARSTGCFAVKRKLGEGSFGGVYKGFLKDLSTHVAVKRISKTSNQGMKEYASEVRIISRLRHRNLVQLIGWCHEKGKLLLVYEYMENRSLDSHLFKAKSLLTWETRYKIAIGLASALLYLHEGWDQCVLHRDIKSSNVMLDSNFNAKLGDFGLAKLVDHEKGSQTTVLAGTLGYMAPECVVTGKANKETDVFSFGVVALEIACGRKSISYKTQEKHVWLVEWVWELYGTEKFFEVVDRRLHMDFDEDEVKRLMIVGLWCVHPDPKLRPSMRQVIQVLNLEASLPVLPSKMPVASYSTTCIPSLPHGSNEDLSTSSSYLYGR